MYLKYILNAAEGISQFIETLGKNCVIIRLYHKEESTLTRLSVFWGSFLFVFSIFEEWLGKVKAFREKAILRKGGV